MPPDSDIAGSQQANFVFIDTLRALGGKAGNVTLRRYLAKAGWDIGNYWSVREYYLRKGEVALFRCRGGGVTIVDPSKDTHRDIGVAPTAVVQPQREADYYIPLAETLKSRWCIDLEFRDFVVEVTGERQPGVSTGGAWTQPDIVVVHVGTYRHVPGKHLEVITFEVKEARSVDVKAPHQAMAHLKAATQAYVVIVGTPTISDDDEDRIHEEARKCGVGLIIAPDPLDYETWTFPEEPPRHNFDPAEVDGFISSQLSSETARKIERWIR